LGCAHAPVALAKAAAAMKDKPRIRRFNAGRWFFSTTKGSGIKTGMAGLEEYYPTEAKKWSPFTPTHQFPYTLEQEIVKNMTTQKFNTTYVKAPWRPILDDTHDATPVNM
jgi:hypothetical protein